MLKRSLLLIIMLAIFVAGMSFSPAMASELSFSDKLLLTEEGGQGIGVSTEAPGSSVGITPNGVNPPTGSNVISLGSYNGTITWASGLLYTDQNYKNTSGTTIKLNTNFRYYFTKDDAINRENPLEPSKNITVYMYKAGDSPTTWNLVSSKTVSLNNSSSVTFNVTKNQGYYFEFACNIGNYVAGDFTITK